MNDIQSVLTSSASTLMGTSDSADLDVEVLLCHVLKKNRSYLRTWPERELNKTQLDQFNRLLEQRQQGQPIAYITGNREFWSRDFYVDSNVLIPRPDTETLIELCLELIQHKPNARLVDLGTGSGIIAITLAAEFPQLDVTAVDNSATALKIAQKNAQLNQTTDIHFLQSNWFDQLADESFDFIVSNPPYIAPDDPHLDQGDVYFEPESALIAEQQGLADIMHISKHSQHYLNKGGYLILEHGYNQKQSVHDILQQHQYQNIHCLHDLSGQPRISYAQCSAPTDKPK
ncbi:protein-(glutamine-N5) methyltransferase, release factor-specific [Methylococcaceae bacterium CS1]|uniref:peptide chain release factor N(5)-glutamine methyltransferase n=1 Tax=Bathymodiolus platifrons methanotrophic gill symbiont TaxID=113268 RepID=UPI000B41DA53|nr:peptide chain release factor N(5)-glutamine methyltransferase [Bathymodiolus platifrons methanotrophic gill symbiont]MCK5870929.1 peptide chain release factor N(5)-glutamine methyltransferase [Methyloprofundus sp.]TXK93795.1 protein-(glutamine-N5) methyltransferase, release factor-specific [Methylococcaceae bacterium CS4]TXL02586.1 protein-(glutamine-N5) methyltransferase, release factor-specific [Methylococcaceae bacterium CS3]TXL02587.1 protein-(glutamine-N5) methyltransferase, release fac